MSTLTTKVTITLATVVAGLGAAAPALADDGTAVTAVSPTPAETVANAIYWGGRLVAVLAGIVLLMKLLQGYRRSQWRRHWIERSTVLYVGSAQLGWPSGSISGRSTRPSAGLSSMSASISSPMSGSLAGSSVARSATRL